MCDLNFSPFLRESVEPSQLQLFLLHAYKVSSTELDSMWNMEEIYAAIPVLNELSL